MKFGAAYAALILLIPAIGFASYAVMRDAPKRDSPAVWWRGLSKAEIAVQVESGRLPVRPDGAQALVPVCFPKGPRLCVVRAVENNQLLLIYVQVIGDVWTIQHVENLSAGSAVPTP